MQNALQNAVQKFAATGQKVHVIAERADKLLTGMWKVAMDQLSERMEQHLIFEVCNMLNTPSWSCATAWQLLAAPVTVLQQHIKCVERPHTNVTLGISAMGEALHCCVLRRAALCRNSTWHKTAASGAAHNRATLDQAVNYQVALSCFHWCVCSAGPAKPSCWRRGQEQHPDRDLLEAL